MNVYKIYFSPTGTSRKNITTIAEGMYENSFEIDITLPELPYRITFTPEDLVIFGGPVYGGRLCQEHVKRLQIFRAIRTPCVITVTYGNRDFDDALVEMYDIVSSLGFIPIAAGALVAKHTYGKIQEDRPDDKDCKKNNDFGKKVKSKLDRQDYSLVQVPGNRPYKKSMKRGRFIPSTKQDICTSCRLCAMLCPKQAISYTTFTKLKNRGCISCFHCIQICPVQAKVMEGQEYEEFANALTDKLAIPKENQYFI